jgi:hypothetical protein
LASARAAAIGLPEDSGLTPKTATFYVNGGDSINNNKTESLGVAITSNGNIVIGWEDDGDALTDLEAVWTLYNTSGAPLTADTEMAAKNPDFAGQTVTSKFLSYFRKDKSPVPGRTSWGPKIKANLFGGGFGMGATSFELGVEVPELAAIQLGSDGSEGDFPGVQLLSNNGDPISIVTGVSDADADPAGDIRIGDWDYLSNGNVVVVGESRQKDDLVTKYGGAAAGNHAIYRIVDQTGKEVKAVTKVSETADPSEIWHGVAVTKGGFAVRFASGGRATVRLFDNDGNPKSGNLDIGTLAGHEIAAGGGRGDGTGFHGNGVDAYAIVSSGTDDQGAPAVWVTVLGNDGKVRNSHTVSDDTTLTKPGRTDVAIDTSGRVIAVYSDTSPSGGAFPVILGRMFDAAGKPLGATFYVSETETGPTVNAASSDPRVTWQGGLAAVVWVSQNDPETANKTVAGRLFSTFEPGSVESVGLKRIVSDTPVIIPDAGSLGNWEPFASVIGTSTFLIEGNTFAEGSATEQRFVVALQPAAGGAMKQGEGFYDDAGKPFKGAINASRQNGNPGRVAGDKRPGAVNFMVGGEASPHTLTEFGGDNRWNLGFDRLADGRYATVQSYSLDTATLAQKPLSKALDAINGRLTTGAAAGSQIGRFGGDIVCLDNGNFVVMADDRSQVRDPANSATAVILAPDGKVVKESFLVENKDIWSNLAAFKGGFCIRVHQNLHFFDNNGVELGVVDQATSGESFDTGRGDGTRIAGHINSPYVFLAGKVTTAALVKLAVFDTRTRKSVAVAEVSEPAFAGDFDRVNVAADALNRVVVSWVSKPVGYEMEQVAARVLAVNEAGNAITPLTKSFLAFVNTAKTGGIHTLGMSVAMTTRQICIAAKGEINLLNKPEQGATSQKEMNFYTVFTHPDPKDDPTTPVGGPVTGGAKLAIARNGANINITWTASGVSLESASAITGPWTKVTTTGTSHSTAASGAAVFYRLHGQ